MNNPLMYLAILVYFFNVTYLIGDSFYQRYKPIDPAYLHRIEVLVMAVALAYILFRVVAERKMKFK